MGGGRSIAAFAGFENRKPNLTFDVQTELAPERNTLNLPGFTAVDPCDGVHDPEFQFNDVAYRFVADASRMVRSKLDELGVSNVGMMIEPHWSDGRASIVRVVAEGRQPGVIELHDHQYAVDVAELAASGLVAAYQVVRHAELISLQGGAVNH